MEDTAKPAPRNPVNITGRLKELELDAKNFLRKRIQAYIRGLVVADGEAKPTVEDGMPIKPKTIKIKLASLDIPEERCKVVGVKTSGAILKMKESRFNPEFEVFHTWEQLGPMSIFIVVSAIEAYENKLNDVTISAD